MRFEQKQQNFMLHSIECDILIKRVRERTYEKKKTAKFAEWNEKNEE